MGHRSTIAGLHAAYGGGADVSAVLADVYTAIEAADDPGIFISLRDRDAVMADARRLGPFDPGIKPLWGVPFAVKDNIDVAGMRTTAACPAYAYSAAATAFAVERLMDAGAILIGKTNLDQFATGLVGLRSPYPPPRNAIDPALVPGGSSSGSAVAVSRGLVPFALGTDTAGSGRVPAAFNNIVGLKPSPGLVSTRGVVPACRSLDCVSIFALTVEDSWRVLRTIAAYDPSDPYARRIVPAAPSPARDMRIGIPDQRSREFFGDRHAACAFDAAVACLEGTGAAVVEVDLALFRETAELLYAGPWVAERYQAIRVFFETHAGDMHPVTREIIGKAKGVSAADAFAGFHRLAELRRAVSGVWQGNDALMLPTVPGLCTVAEVNDRPFELNTRLGTYTNFVNLLDLCAIAVPGPQRPDGLPGSVTFVAPHGHDGRVAALGARLHEAAGVRSGRVGVPPAPWHGPDPQEDPDLIEIATVGAHMSGLPLNKDLVAAGGAFRRRIRTEPSYRLFALPGGPPFRPGLLRVAAGEGHAIETEVWALPAAGFGRFVDAIPSPLGLGTLRLADGSRPKGFLVEPQGVLGARDISALGGWRAYLEHGRGAAEPQQALPESLPSSGISDT